MEINDLQELGYKQTFQISKHNIINKGNRDATILLVNPMMITLLI